MVKSEQEAKEAMEDLQNNYADDIGKIAQELMEKTDEIHEETGVPYELIDKLVIGQVMFARNQNNLLATIPEVLDIIEVVSRATGRGIAKVNPRLEIEAEQSEADRIMADLEELTGHVEGIDFEQIKDQIYGGER